MPAPSPLSPSQTPRPDSLTEAEVHYSNVLCELWGGYTRFLHVGMAAAGFTVVAIGQYLGGLTEPLGDLGAFVKASVFFAGLAGVSFALCRWLCQVIMERQVYGPREVAEAYFAASETRKPNALRYSPQMLQRFYVVNDTFKFVGAISLLLSWISIVIVLFLQVDMAI